MMILMMMMMMTIMILMMMIMTIMMMMIFMMMMMNRRKTSCLLACIFIHPIGIYVLIEDDLLYSRFVVLCDVSGKLKRRWMNWIS